MKTRVTAALTVWAMLGVFVMTMETQVHAQDARAVAKSVTPSVVLLVMQDDKGQSLSLGSGFVVGDGVLVTNLHVIAGASRGYAKLSDRKDKLAIQGTLGVDDVHDLAILSVDGLKAAPLKPEQLDLLGQPIPQRVDGLKAAPLKPGLDPSWAQFLQPNALPLGDSSKVSTGDDVYVVGNPQGLEGTFSAGIVSGIRKIGEDSLLQITAPISPGSSGGPVTNSKGEVIGVSVATFKGELKRT